jgi:modification methylase
MTVRRPAASRAVPGAPTSWSPVITTPAPHLPLSVWTTAQRTARTQRTGRYLPLSTEQPAKRLPAIAGQAIAAYTQPGDLVLDPMCGIGTTLVEAMHLGRDAVGVEYEPRWAQLAGANLRLARRHGAPGRGEVVDGDARHLPGVVDPAIRGLVALVLTSPPYGASLHGQVSATPGAGVTKSHYKYSTDPANLAHAGHHALLEGMVQILTGCSRLLRPGGIVAMTVRPYRYRGTLIDLPGAMIRAGQRAGLTPLERNVALLAGLRGDQLIPRASFFALEQVRRARANNTPLHVIAHEDLLVFGASRSCSPPARKLRPPQPAHPEQS